MTTTTRTKIVQALDKLIIQLVMGMPHDKANAGPLLRNAFIWDEISRVADRQSAAAWQAINDSGVVNYDNLQAGAHMPIQSDLYTLSVQVTEPVRRFSASTLANTLHNSKWRVPLHHAITMIEEAKEPTKPRLTKTIVERDTR